MSLHPVRTSRHRQRRQAARLRDRNQWKPWRGWTAKKVADRTIPLLITKAGIAIFCGFLIGVLLSASYLDRQSPLFHSFTASATDPTTAITKITAPNNDLSTFNIHGSAAFTTCTFSNACVGMRATGQFPNGQLSITGVQVYPGAPVNSTVFHSISGINPNTTIYFDIQGNTAGLLLVFLVNTTLPATLTFHGAQSTLFSCVCTVNYASGNNVLSFNSGLTFSTLILSWTTSTSPLGWQQNFGGYAMVESKNPIGDLSVAVQKELEMAVIWTNTANTVNDTTLNFAYSWGMFLTTNPNLWQTGDPNWTPYNDNNIQALMIITPTTTATDNHILFIQQKIGDTLKAEDTSNCSGSAYLCFNTPGIVFTPNTANYDWMNLNYTGVACAAGVNCVQAGNGTITCPLSNVIGGPGCSYYGTGGGNLPLNVISHHGTNTTSLFPVFQLTGQTYYVGFFVGAKQTTQIKFCFDQDQCGKFFTPLQQGCSTSSMEVEFCVPTATVLAQGVPDSGGFFGSVWRTLSGIGNSVVQITQPIWGPVAGAVNAAGNSLLSAFVAAEQTVGSFVINGLAQFETFIRILLNGIGNVLGFGNIGDMLFNLLSAIQQFFTNTSYGLPAFFLNFPSYFNAFLQWLQVIFPFLGPMFSITNAILGLGVSMISTGIFIFRVGLTLVLFGYGTLLIFLFIVFAADDGPGGVLTYLGTAEGLAFSIINTIVMLVNLGLDIIVTIISLIPKPFVQMQAGKIPRLPTVDSRAHITFPRFDFAELRSGNLVCVFLISIGFYLDVWFESRNPALPGSIGNLVPSIATQMQLLSSLLPMFQIFALFGGGASLLFIILRPIQLIGVDLGEFDAIGVGSGGFQSGQGPSSFSIKGGTAKVPGFVKARIEKAGGKVKTRQEIGTIEKGIGTKEAVSTAGLFD